MAPVCVSLSNLGLKGVLYDTVFSVSQSWYSKRLLIMTLEAPKCKPPVAGLDPFCRVYSGHESIAYRLRAEECYWPFGDVNIAELPCHFHLTTMLLNSECWQLSLTRKEAYKSLLGLANFDHSRPVALNIAIDVFSRSTGSWPMVIPVTLGRAGLMADLRPSHDF